MKIIKHGILPEKKIYHGKCRNCQVEIEFERGEAKETYDQQDGNYLIITCPTIGCKKEIIVGF